MQGDSPPFTTTSLHEELVEHVLLNPTERARVDTCYGDGPRHGVAVLRKAVQDLGYFPHDLQQVPEVVRPFIAHQRQRLWDHTRDDPWQSPTHDGHLALIRQYTGVRLPTGQDTQALERWLRTHGAPDAPSEEELRACAYVRLRALGLELPASTPPDGPGSPPGLLSGCL